jgi:hypothetical protein
MSELTKCNYCTLKAMEWAAKQRGVTVIMGVGVKEMAGWKTARYSDRDEPSAHFMKLTDHCVC